MNADERGLMHRELTDRILKTYYDVYNEMGFGYLEHVYEKSMMKALADAGLKAQRQVPISVYFRGELVGSFEADIIVEGLVLLELKAARALDSAHEAQTLNYLRATIIEVALLLNFGPKAEFRRFAFENTRKRGLPPSP